MWNAHNTHVCAVLQGDMYSTHSTFGVTGRYVQYTQYMLCYRVICTVCTVHVVLQGDMYSMYSTCGVPGRYVQYTHTHLLLTPLSTFCIVKRTTAREASLDVHFCTRTSKSEIHSFILCTVGICCLYTLHVCMYNMYTVSLYALYVRMYYIHTVSLYTVQMYVLYTYCVPIYCTNVCTIHILCPYILYKCMYYTHTVSLYTVHTLYTYVLQHTCSYYTHTVPLHTYTMYVRAIIYMYTHTYTVCLYRLYIKKYCQTTYVCNWLIYSNIPPHLSAPGRSLLRGNQQPPRSPSTDSGSSVHAVWREHEGQRMQRQHMVQYSGASIQGHSEYRTP